MARNKFDVDERLESPFQWKHLKRAGKYIGRHKYKMLAALALSALASVASLYIPKITQWVLDEAVPNKDTAMIGKMALAFVGVIGLSIVFSTVRSSTIKKPKYRPHSRKFQFAPCQMPVSPQTTAMLKIQRPMDTRLPPSGI